MAPSKSAAKKKSAGAKPKAAPAKTKPTRAVYGKAAPKAIDAYIQQRNPTLKDVVSAVRRLVRQAVPAAAEAINPWGVPVLELNGTLCFLMVGKQHVTLGFAQGTLLSDPARLLEGTGKNIRHVKLKKVEQVNDPHLRSLLLEAAVLNSKQPLNATMRRSVQS
jgi:hypothetical protein